jgi:preprotein translocase subunit SecY
MAVAVIAFVVFMERAQRKITIQYPKRQVGMKVYGGESSHLPVKVNPAGVIPAIFASSLLLLPATVTTFAGPGGGGGGFWDIFNAYMGRGQPLNLLIFGGLIVFFAYFYTANVVVQVRRRRRQPAQAGRLHPRHPARPEDDRLPRLRRQPHPRGRLGLPRRGLPAA